MNIFFFISRIVIIVQHLSSHEYEKAADGRLYFNTLGQITLT
ncbi:hypothetical protein [Paenibacillus sp.]|nr:hypothetical protein [Paenibacillus sp.]